MRISPNLEAIIDDVLTPYVSDSSNSQKSKALQKQLNTVIRTEYDLTEPMPFV